MTDRSRRIPSLGRLLRACGWGLAVLLTSCATWRDDLVSPYDDALASFDSILALDADGREPDRFVVQDVSRRYSPVVFFFRSPSVPFLPTIPGGTKGLVEVEVPAAELRDDLDDMVAQSGGRISRLVDIAWRACYLLSNDNQHELNQFSSIAAIRAVLEEIEVDVLSVALPRDARFDRRGADYRPIATLEELQAERRPRPLSPDEEAVFRDAILVGSRIPRRYPAHRRALLRAMEQARVTETDSDLSDLLDHAMTETLGVTLVEELRTQLLSPSSDVQQRAVRTLRGLSDPRIVPWLLAAGVGRIYDEDEGGQRSLQLNVGTQRLMVHLCAQLSGDVLWQTVGNGSSPAYYLLQVAQKSPVESLRRFAVDGLARALRRPLDPSSDWIQEAFTEALQARSRRTRSTRPATGGDS